MSIIKSLDFVFEGEKFRVNVYKFEKEFVEGVAKFERTKIDNPEAIEFWHSRGYFSQGTWNAVYGLHNLCGFAARDRRDVYIYEEINESKLER